MSEPPAGAVAPPADAPMPKEPQAVKDKKAAKELKRERRAAAKAQQDGAAISHAKPEQKPKDAAPRAKNMSEAAPAKSTAAHLVPQASLDKDLSNVGVLGDASLFGNVVLPRSAQLNAFSWNAASARATIHPEVLSLCHQLATFNVRGANKRAIAVLRALGAVIRDYRTPQGAVLSRDLLTRVSQQVGHIVESRPMNTSTGHAVRFLKYEISVVDSNLGEAEAKEHLLDRIEHFIRDRIIYAAKVIQTHAAAKIHDGDVVMAYARSSVIEGTLLQAHRNGVKFEVIVIDSRPLFEGRELAERLIGAGIPTTYGLLSSLSTLIPRVNLLLLGTSSLLSNGAPYARAGTAMCAMLAHGYHIPVIICCETYKFSDRIQLDSFVVNEAGNCSDLLSQEDDSAQSKSKLLTRAECSAEPRLKVVQLLYDVTPPRYISAVASEVGLGGTESVGVILRDYKSVLFGI
ncbi:hypothetical protein MVES1_002376 [Malassezia vespertilionis]|uniref:Translation initiation factor eIF2B subunit delta n=1 Tax=Malassezia vespertilionis TaxID=2020962 RepID=A0A2N1JBH3_9BASI|nr:uncharacterized protein MVES1_002376 [Malassezia vespertilionis]PKI83897.1 hypothetical protein MVES_002242 [Malassezia vespertilionis]WFD07020.1 hypothetical protein MVES1_002376 [Malassezia vespertilionis]